MARLPDKTALGSPSLRASGGTVSGDTGLGSVGAGLSRLGSALSGIAQEQKQEDDTLDLIKADALHKTRLSETQRAFDTDPDFQSFAPRYNESAMKATADAASIIRDPKNREKWLARADLTNESVRDRVLDRGTMLARQHKEIEIEDALKVRRSGYLDPSLDDTGRESVLADMDDYITAAERTGLVLPKSAQRMREGYIEGAIGDDAERRLWTDPDGLLRDLQMEPEKPQASIQRRSDGMATISTGSGAKLVVSSEHAERFAGALADLEAAGIEIKADQSGGLANRNIRGTNVPSQHKFGRAIDLNWSENARGTQGKIPAGIARQVAEKWGLTWGGDWKNPDPMHFEVAKNARPLPVESGPRLADASGKEGIEASDLPPPFTHSKYSRLSPAKRAALIFKAKTAQSAVTQQQVRDDLARIRRTGEPELAADGSTSLDRASRFLTPNQVAKLRLQWDEAQMEHDAIAPLKTLSELEDESGMSDVDRHFAALAPDEGLPEESYASRARVLDKTVREWKKIQEQRRKDPAMAVNDAPEVRAAFEMVSKRIPDVGIVQDEDGDLDIAAVDGAPAVNAQKAQEIVIEARLAAQRERGVPEVLRSPITRRQAERLLDMPDPSLLDEKTFIDKLRAASDRAEQIYGPKYGRQAFESAVRFKLREKEHKEAAAGMIAKMVRGEPVSQRDIGRINTLDEIAASDGVFSDQFLPQFMDDQARPFISPQALDDVTERNAAASDRLRRDANRKPNEQHKQWLRDNPDQWRSFDLKFGPGSSLKVLGGKDDK